MISRACFILSLFLPKTLLALKVLMLVIASDNEERYIELQKLWSSYMHSDPEHVEVYFIRGDPALATQSEVKDDVVWSRTKECTVPGIVIKTLYSFEHFASRLNEFDFVIRTNLSSFYVFPRLLEYLETLPKKGCYSGPLARYDLTAASGCGIIFSSDVVELIVKQRSYIIGTARSDYDDVVIWKLLLMRRININPSPMALVNTPEALEHFKANPDPKAFHFRVGYPNVYTELVDLFYPRARAE